MYRPPCQTNFLEIINVTLEKIDIYKKEMHILGDFNMPLTYDLKGFKSRINRHLLTVGPF